MTSYVAQLTFAAKSESDDSPCQTYTLQGINAMAWQVEQHPRFAEEFTELPEAVQDELLALAEALKELGPQLKRPRSDTLNGSKHANMK